MTRKLFYLAFYAALAAFLAWLIHRNSPALAGLRAHALVLLIPYSALVASQIALSVRSNQRLFAGYMEGNTLGNNMRLSLVSTLGNLLPVSLGFLSKGVYAYRVNNLAFATFTLLAAHQMGAALLWNGLACLLFSAPAHSLPMAGLGLAMATAAFAPHLDFRAWAPARFQARLERWLPEAEYASARQSGWRQYPIQFLLQGSIQLLSACALFLAFRAMDIAAAPWQVLLIFTAVNLSRYISFTPGGLGIPEGLGGAVSASFGIPFSLAYLAIIASRVLDLGLTLLAVPFFFPLGKPKPVAEHPLAS